MISYTLKCNGCHQEYNAWFSSMNEYDNQKEKGLLECLLCGSKDVDKGLMAPAIKISNNNDYDPKQILRQARRYVEENFENVGDQFADEAIAINQGEAKNRDIYGKVDKNAEEKLANEGIPYVKLPWVPKEDA